VDKMFGTLLHLHAWLQGYSRGGGLSGSPLRASAAHTCANRPSGPEPCARFAPQWPGTS